MKMNIFLERRNHYSARQFFYLRHMEKTLSQAQRDQLLMNTAKEDLLMKKEMMESFKQSNKTLEESLSKMTMCLTSLGDGIASGMQMLAMALSGQSQNNVPQVPRPHFNTYSGFASAPSYGNNSINSINSIVLH